MDASRSILSGGKPTNVLLDAYPSLREWRTYRIGLIAALIEIATWLALFCDIDMGISIRASHPNLLRLREVLLLTFFACIPVALIGVFLDKRKSLSAIVLGSSIPALMVLLMWSGYW
jgi:hypothetical protein